MSNIIRYKAHHNSPLHYLQQFSERLSDELDQLRHPVEDGSDIDWRPNVDIKEEPDCFVLYADVPGVAPKDIEISTENGVLTIRGERTTTKQEKEKDKGYTRFECFKGRFSRHFYLPDTADIERISAQGRHGVLKITIPKKTKALAKKIKVEAKED